MQPTSNAWGCKAKTISNFRENNWVSSAAVYYFPNLKFICSPREMSAIPIGT